MCVVIKVERLKILAIIKPYLDITDMSVQIKPTHNDTWDMHFKNTNKFFAAPKPPGNTTACATLDDSWLSGST